MICVCILFLTATGADVFLSESGNRYVGLSPVGKGTVGYVVKALQEATGATVVVKCDKTKSLEFEGDLLLRFPSTRESLIDRVFWLETKDHPKYVPSFEERASRQCLALVLYGPSLEHLREQHKQPWDWKLLGHYGVQITKFVQEFHLNGYNHNDMHPGNLVLGDEFGKIVPLDLGDMRPLLDTLPAHSDIEGPLKPATVLKDRDLRQIVCSIRFLFSGNYAFFAEKRTTLERMRNGSIGRKDIPAKFGEIIEYVYKINEEINYDWIKDMFAQIALDAGNMEYMPGRIPYAADSRKEVETWEETSPTPSEIPESTLPASYLVESSLAESSLAGSSLAESGGSVSEESVSLPPN